MLITKNKTLRQIVAVAETTNLLFLKLLLRKRRGAREFPGVIYREYLSRAGRDIWRSASIFELFPELAEKQPRIVLEHLPGNGIHDAVNELAYLALVCHAIAPSLVFEIGTFRGRTALNFALNSPDDCRVLTLDLPLEEAGGAHLGSADRALAQRREVGREYVGKDVSHKIEQLYGDSRFFSFAPYEAQADIVFIDGGHTYDIALCDTRNALRLCRPGGVILWHDFGNYGAYADVIRAVLDSVPADLSGPPAQSRRERMTRS
jgi:predicted O-methyltransferase YrrM